MSIAQTVRSLTHDWFTPIAVTEAEIREELEFHLHMRTADNIAAGMDAEEASQDAQLRFGDFEQNFQECRKATLGKRIMLQRLQHILTLLLVSAVVCLVAALMRTQSQYESQLKALRRTIQTNHQQLIPAGSTLNWIPTRQWCLPVEGPSLTERQKSNEKLANSFLAGSVKQAWSDWGALDEICELHD